MAKRIPPSQRAERQMDETARAIALSREIIKDEKPEDGPATAATKPTQSRLTKGITSRKVVTENAFPSTKRPKKG